MSTLGPDMSPDPRFASGDTTTIIRMLAPLMASTGRTGSRMVSSSALDRGITAAGAMVGMGGQAIGVVDMHGRAGVTVMADTLGADMPAGMLAEDSTGRLASMAVAGATTQVADSMVEVDSTVAADAGKLS